MAIGPKRGRNQQGTDPLIAAIFNSPMRCMSGVIFYLTYWSITG